MALAPPEGSPASNQYMHLQAGTPIATNPRTGQPWASGNTIYAGELIGFIGVTGNANPNVPHLHIKTTMGINGTGTAVNPVNYLNATVSTSTTTITTPCD